MPIYEYQCDDCGTRFERLIRRLSAPGAEKALCPKCGESHLTQQVSTFAAMSDSAPRGAIPPVTGGMSEDLSD